MLVETMRVAVDVRRRERRRLDVTERQIPRLRSALDDASNRKEHETERQNAEHQAHLAHG